MPKKKISTTKLDSLYDALKIPREGNVPCLGHMKSNFRCAADRTHRRDNIESTLHDIIDALKDGDTKDSDGVQKLLMDLARRLTCRKKHHDHPVTRGSRDCDKYEYVAFVLGKRLGYWDEDADGETPESTSKRRPVPLFSLHGRLKQAGKSLVVPDFTISRHRKQAKSSDEEDEYLEHDDEDYDEDYDEDSDEDYNQESSEDEYEDEELEDRDEDEEGDEEGDEEEDEEEDEEVTEVSTEESTMSRRQRPKPKREGPMIGDSAVVTPIKQRGRPSRNSRASTPRTGQVVDRFDSLSVIDDASTSSSESVISPGASEVFSPVSTASTPMSIGGLPDSEVRPRRSRYTRGEDESPTRRRRPSTDDDLTDGARRSRRAANNHTASGSLRISKYGNDSTTTREKSSRKGNKQLEQGLQLGDQDFDEVGNPVGKLLKSIEYSPAKKSLLPGWVYCFADKRTPGYLKIGYKLDEDKNGKTMLSLAEQQDDTQVRKRLRTWELDCKLDIDCRFIVYMPCAARTMEKLIQTTLHKSNRRGFCPNRACTKDHREWFEISEAEARRAVEVWQQFSKLMPYNDMGRLDEFWHNYARGKCNSFSRWPTDKWVDKIWAEAISPAAVERRNMICKLQEKEAQLAERRKETEERKKELDFEIQKLEREEEKIQQELARLQSQR
ncbi:hypothetical protein NCS57_00279900 [Fusarium keratoplasticum]|uniref:Uncharacterized protein n=1 Tax=Fusarium keratoplasticum TaxID=1328300 RepID=A0ACC0RD98_9HYPO|nr:hypothetical protein NCS57_00279900 [Fusarium keratoplasticum]KAI8680002.1 hypothetical protein NCS57_00279900 [Fusarium keratoplasticum]